MSDAAKITVGFEAEVARLQAQLAQAKAIVEKETREMNRVTRRSSIFGDGIRDFKNTIRTVGDVMQYASGALGTAAAFAASMREDFEESQKSLERLPFIFGDVARLGRMVGESLFGSADLRRSLAEWEAFVATQGDVEKATRASKAVISDMENQLRLMSEKDKALAADIRMENDLLRLAEKRAVAERDILKARSERTAEVVSDEDTKALERVRNEMAMQRSAAGFVSPGLLRREEEIQGRIRNAEQSVRRMFQDLLEAADKEFQLGREMAQRRRDAAVRAAGLGNERESLDAETKALSDRLRKVSVDPSAFVTTGNTAIGAFRSAGELMAAQAARSAKEQTDLQRKIERNTNRQAEILEEIRELQRIGGWQ